MTNSDLNGWPIVKALSNNKITISLSIKYRYLLLLRKFHSWMILLDQNFKSPVNKSQPYILVDTSSFMVKF